MSEYALDAPKVGCPADCKVQMKKSNSNSSGINKSCDKIFDTYSCISKFEHLLNMSKSEPEDEYTNSNYEICDQNSLSVNITPYYIKTDMGETLKLNISVKIYDRRTKGFVLRQICIKRISKEKEDKHDLLCNSRARPTKWETFHWSCRNYDWSALMDNYSGDDFLYPIRNYYDCFHVGMGFNILSIHLLLYPQNCRNVYTYMAIDKLHYKLLTADTDHKDNSWLPLIFVDTNRQDGLIGVNFNLPTPDYGISKIIVEIYKTDEYRNSTEQLLVKSRDVDVAQSNGSLFFTGLKRGYYKVSAHPWLEQCANGRCRLFVYIPFELKDDFYAPWASNNGPHVNPWLILFWAIAALAVAVCFWAISLTAYSKYKARLRLMNPITLTFNRRPKVFFIYTDDTIEHRLCVIYLAEYLRDNMNCEVFLDEFVLRNPILSETNPNETEWAIKSAAHCDYFLIVFSEGSKITFDQNRHTLELKSERPWVELFGLSITCVLEDILQQTRLDPKTRLPKVVCVTFNYSNDSAAHFSAIPEQFRHLPCPKFKIPDQIADLICHLHQMQSASFTDEGPLGGTRLLDQIARTKNYYEVNSDWLNDRLTPLEQFDRSDIVRTFAAIDALRDSGCPGSFENVNSDNLQELYTRLQENQAEINDGVRYSLLPPDSADILDTGDRQYMLLPYREEEEDEDQGVPHDELGLPLMVLESPKL